MHPDIQKFIIENTGADITKLALQKNPFPDVEWILILNQIEARTKAKEKLGWKPKYNLEMLVKEMMEADLKIFQKEKLYNSLN